MMDTTPDSAVGCRSQREADRALSLSIAAMSTVGAILTHRGFRLAGSTGAVATPTTVPVPAAAVSSTSPAVSRSAAAGNSGLFRSGLADAVARRDGSPAHPASIAVGVRQQKRTGGSTFGQGHVARNSHLRHHGRRSDRDEVRRGDGVCSG